MGNPYFDPGYQPYTQSVLVGTSVLFIILPIVAVALRFYSRALVQAQLGIDDWITIPSMIICIGLAINQIIGEFGPMPYKRPSALTISQQLQPMAVSEDIRSSSTANSPTPSSYTFTKRQSTHTTSSAPSVSGSSSFPFFSSSGASSRSASSRLSTMSSSA